MEKDTTSRIFLETFMMMSIKNLLRVACYRLWL